MKIFTSAFEGISAKNNGEKQYFSEYCIEQNIPLRWILISYFYARNHEQNVINIRNRCEEMLVDSGAHSFQFGAKVDFVEYTKQYAEFIKKFDRPNVVGYFEMDIENVIGYSKVLELRKILESVTDKIIPVWHPTRGIDEYEKMCKQYAGKIVAIGGFRGTDIKDGQFLMFLKVAKKYGCRVHCLGMTRTKILDKVPFDYTDSATWVTATNMGHPIIDGKQISTSKGRFPKTKGIEKFSQYEYNYREFLRLQEHYYYKWKKECKD